MSACPRLLPCLALVLVISVRMAHIGIDLGICWNPQPNIGICIFIGILPQPNISICIGIIPQPYICYINRYRYLVLG